MIETNKYPVDFEAITKGDILTIEMLEKITAEKRESQKFIWKVLALQGQIMDETGYTVKNDGGALVILTDEESSKYNDRMFYRFKRGMFNRHKLMQAVDVRQLSDTMRSEHERKILNQSRYISALKSPKKFEVKVDNVRQLEK